MHLSLLSEGFFTDSAAKAGRHQAQPSVVAGREHRDGVVRGLVVMGVAGLLLGLTLLSCPIHSASADTRCGTWTAPASERPQAAVWWEAPQPVYRSNETLRPFHAYAQAGTAVSLIALRQRFRSACR